MRLASIVGASSSLALALLVAPVASAQERRAEPAPEHSDEALAPNSIYAEGLGPGLFYSVNYERIVAPDVGVRGGLGYVGLSANAGSSSSKATYLSIPLTVSYLGLRSRKSALEVGGGVTFVYTSAAVSSLGANSSGSGVTPFVTALVGYRLHPLESHPGFQFRVGLSAIGAKGMAYSSGNPDKFGFILWPYISFGAGF